MMLTGCQTNKPEDQLPNMSLSDAMSEGDTIGYARAIAPRTFSFPTDHASHPNFKTEWWYATGNLKDESLNDYGFQFTIFRSALSPSEPQKESEWAARQLFMGHFTITDLKNKTFHVEERFQRAANGLAGSATSPIKIWLENWVFEMVDSSNNRLPTFYLKADQENASISLNLHALKPIVLQGDSGLSQKGPEPGNASYYYSITRLQAEGTLKLNNQPLNVTGQVWLDREWSTSALSKNQVGWDWFSLQLDDNREIMIYQLRQKDGSIDSLSKGMFISADGNYHKLKFSEISLTVINYWESPLGGRYPSGWQLTIPFEKLSLTITPKLQNQELDVQLRYWEGAVTVSGVSNNTPVSGVGYVELTGYATPNPY